MALPRQARYGILAPARWARVHALPPGPGLYSAPPPSATRPQGFRYRMRHQPRRSLDLMWNMDSE